METQIVQGIHLPVADTHFADHLVKGPKFAGRGTYQFAKIEQAMGIIKSGHFGLALDIGAHVGLWTRVLSHRFDQVIAFEPIPEHAYCWRWNQDFPDKTQLFEFAVGQTDGTIAMRRERKNSGNARVDLMFRQDHNAKMVSLDSWYEKNKVGPVDFIKIDVEGYEEAVVLGAEQLIKKCKPTMVVEQKLGNAEMCGFKTNGVIELLKSWGMTVAWIRAGDFCLVFKE